MRTMAIKLRRGVEVILCNGPCHEFKGKDAYFPSTWKAGCGTCKDCSREKSRIAQAKYRCTPRGRKIYKRNAERRRTDPVLRARRQECERRWASSPGGYSAVLLKKHRARNRDMGAPPPDYTLAELAQRLSAHPYCCVTGARLSTGPSGRGVGQMRPWAASIDRIDPSRPYTRDNIRITCVIYNLAKYIFSDDELRDTVLHLLGMRRYVLRAGESWANPNSRPRRAKGYLASELAGRANSIDVRQSRRSSHPISADWVRSRLSHDALFGARLVVSPRVRHPLQPSIDRIDPTGAHDQNCCRVVALIVNEALHAFENGEEELRRLFRLILKPLRHANGGAPLFKREPGNSGVPDCAPFYRVIARPPKKTEGRS